MKEKGKILALLVFMVAILGYTVYNYTVGKIDMTMCMVSLVIIGIPLFNIVNILIRQWKDKD